MFGKNLINEIRVQFQSLCLISINIEEGHNYLGGSTAAIIKCLYYYLKVSNTLLTRKLARILVLLKNQKDYQIKSLLIMEYFHDR